MNKWYQTVVAKDYPLERFLSINGFLGSVEKDNTVIAYFEKKNSVISELKDLKLSIITEDDWEEKWRDYFKPIDFAGFRIVPPWLSDEGNIVINPGRGFGTGHHETTRLAAGIINTLLKREDISNMVDVGTGSGVLAIMSKIIQPDLSITAVDNDPDAIENAIENLELNNMADQIELSTTPFFEIEKTYDLVVANIISSILLSLKDDLKNKTEKWIVLSGILAKELDMFVTRFGFENFDLIDHIIDGEWAGLLLKKRDE